MNTLKTLQLRDGLLPSLSLLTSVSTLLCCALPALLVALGAGAVVAGLVTAVPQIVILSEHKTTVFAVAGGLLVVSAGLRYLNRNAPCPADPRQAAACQRLRRFGTVVLYGAVATYLVGFFFAFLAASFIE